MHQFVPMVLAGVDPVGLLTPGPEPSTSHDRLLAVAGAAPPPGLGIGDHAEATAWEKGEGLGVVRRHSEQHAPWQRPALLHRLSPWGGFSRWVERNWTEVAVVLASLLVLLGGMRLMGI